MLQLHRLLRKFITQYNFKSRDSPHVLPAPEIHIFCRTRDQWAPARCHSRLKRKRVLNKKEGTKSSSLVNKNNSSQFGR